MAAESGTGMRGALRAIAGGCLATGLVLIAEQVLAADLFHRQRQLGGPPAYEELDDLGSPPLPRYFPREGGESDVVVVERQKRIVRGCRPRRVPIPTDAPDDPSYVGSTYGLGKPSYYGFVPALGVDDPFGRPVLPYCR